MRVTNQTLTFTLSLVAVLASATISNASDICTGKCSIDDVSGDKACTFTAVLDLFASELGYYSFKECGEGTNPILGLEPDVVYTFDQSDISNYYHPLGFAYYADGAHDDVDELEPSIPPPESGSGCGVDTTCPAPMYFLNEKYLGVYSNIEAVANLTTTEEDFGLDNYEPQFFLPTLEWVNAGNFSIQLKFSEANTPVADFFYFCHIHQGMTGRIKVINADGTPKHPVDEPAIPYSYETPSEFDSKCGTSNITTFTLPNPKCPEKFVCGAPRGKDNVELGEFTKCIEAMDCAMVVGMTNGVSAESETALFIHQMIPHHQNAVNMAKALMKTNTLDCPDITDEDNQDCVLLEILYSIINNQNYQIQSMRSILEAKGYPEADQCEFNAASKPMVKQDMQESSSEVIGTRFGLLLAVLLSGFIAM